MRARFIGVGIGTYASLEQIGDVAIGADNYHRNVMVRCPVCDNLHVIPILESTGSYQVRWNWNPQTITLAPSVRTSGHRGVCHWTLTNGVFTIHGDSTAERANCVGERGDLSVCALHPRGKMTSAGVCTARYA